MNSKTAKLARYVTKNLTGREVTERMYQILQVPTTRGLYVLDANGVTTRKTTAIRVRLKPGCPREVYKRVKQNVRSYGIA